MTKIKWAGPGGKNKTREKRARETNQLKDTLNDTYLFLFFISAYLLADLLPLVRLMNNLINIHKDT